MLEVAITNLPDENSKPGFVTFLTNTMIKADLNAGRSYFAFYEPFIKEGKVIGAFFSGPPLKC